MDEQTRLCFKLAFNEYLSHWNGDVKDTLMKIEDWRAGKELSEEIVIWEPFENYFAVDLLSFIHNSVYAYKEFIKELKDLEDAGV